MVEDIPIKSIQNPSKGLQQQNNLRDHHTEEDNIISNTKMPSISVYELELVGNNQLSEIKCQPCFGL